MGHRLTSHLRRHRLGDVELERDWDELAEKTSASPFLRPKWFRLWSEIFHADEVSVFSLEDGGLRALAPLIEDGHTMKSPVNEQSPEFDILALDDHDREGLVRLVLSGSDVDLELLKVRKETASVAERAMEEMSHRAVSECMQRSPYLDIAGTWEDYERSLSSNFRQGVRRKRRRLAEQGSLESDFTTGEEGLEDLLTEGFAVESSQWKAAEGTAIASRPETEAFYRAIAHWSAERGWLRLGFLRLDGRAVAFRFDLVCDRVLYHLKGGYEPAFSRQSPGLILGHEAVRRAFEEGLTRFEFLGADEPYKLNWTDSVHERMALRLYAPSLRGKAAWAARAAKDRVKRLH